MADTIFALYLPNTTFSSDGIDSQRPAALSRQLNPCSSSLQSSAACRLLACREYVLPPRACGGGGSRLSLAGGRSWLRVVAHREWNGPRAVGQGLPHRSGVSARAPPIGCVRRSGVASNCSPRFIFWAERSPMKRRSSGAPSLPAKCSSVERRHRAAVGTDASSKVISARENERHVGASPPTSASEESPRSKPVLGRE